MINFARQLFAPVCFRPIRARRGEVRVGVAWGRPLARVLGGVIAAVLVLATSEVTSSRLGDSRSEWSAAAIQALPAVHSTAHQRGEWGLRSTRRTPPRVEVLLAADESATIAGGPKTVGRAPFRWRPFADIVPRGYDATAPPVS